MLYKKALQLIQVRIDRSKGKKVCRVYNPTEQIPHTLLEEVRPNSDLFTNTVTGEMFKYTTEGMVCLG